MTSLIPFLLLYIYTKNNSLWVYFSTITNSLYEVEFYCVLSQGEESLNYDVLVEKSLIGNKRKSTLLFREGSFVYGNVKI